MNGLTMRSRKELKDTFRQMEMKAQKQNVWDTVKAILRRKFIALQAYFKKQEKSQINDLTSHLKKLEKEQQINHKVSKRKKIIKIRAEISKIESKKL